MLTGSWKVYAFIALAAAALALAGFSGSKVGQWKAEAGFASERSGFALREAALTKENTDLRAAIAKQNSAVELMEARTDGIKAARDEAQKRADDLAQFSRSRLEKLDRAMEELKTAGEVLGKYWELRQ